MKGILPILTGLILTCFAGFPATAQTFEWVRSQTMSGNGVHGQNTVATDQQGNVLVAGLLNSKASFGTSQGNGGDVFLRQYSPAGTLLFSQTLTGKVQVQAICYSPTGDFYLLGRFNDSARFSSQHVLYGSNSFPFPFLAKYSAAGVVQWVKNMRANDPTIRYISAITTDPAGNLYAACNTMTSNHSYLKKLDPAGTELLHINQTNVRKISSIALDQRGNLYAAGSCVQTGALFGGVSFGTGFSYELYLASYTPAGVPRWVNFTEDGSCYAPELKADKAGHLYMAGILTGKRPLTFGTVMAQGNTVVYDFFLTRVDTAGTFKWVREVPQVNTGDAGIGFDSNWYSTSCLAVDSANNVYMAGRMRNTIDWGNNIINTTGTTDDLLVQKYNAAGNLLWSKTAGGSGIDRGSSVAINTAGEVFLAGTAQGTVTFDTIQHTNPGTIYPVLAKINTQTSKPSGFSNTTNEASLVIYPNPANDNVVVTLPARQAGLISIYNATGQLVNQEEISEKENTINLDKLPAGWYVVQLQTAGKLYLQRLVKQ